MTWVYRNEGYKRLTLVRNSGELAEGWYDPVTLEKAQASASSNATHTERQPRDSPSYDSPKRSGASSDEDVVGPTMPGGERNVYKSDKRRGPAIPNLQDLELQRGMAQVRLFYSVQNTDTLAKHQDLEQEDSLARRQDLHVHRQIDRKKQKERLDELIPRAEAGSKDRLLEKKREKADSNRAFASAKMEAGGIEEVPESDLLGNEDGGIEGFKKQRKEMDRKKNEREVRREEILRARMVRLPQPNFPLSKQIGSTETISRCSRAPPKRKNADLEKYNRRNWKKGGGNIGLKRKRR